MKINAIKERTFKQKAGFSPQLFALAIDFFVCILIIWAFTMPFTRNSSVVDDLRQARGVAISDFFYGNGSRYESVSRVFDIQFDIDEERILISTIAIVVYIGYFIIFEFLKNGQTIGKKLLRIRVENKEQGKSLTLISMIIRPLILNWIFIAFVSLLLSVLGLREHYFYIMAIVIILQIVIVIICIVQMKIREDGRGLQDILSCTRVVKVEK